MGKVNNAIKMLFILKRKDKVNSEYLSGELEVSARHIRRYKEDLDPYFNIESISGRDGGYKLKDDYFPFREVLSENEIRELNLAINYINDDFIKESKSLRDAIGKINFSIIKSYEEKIFNEQIIPYSSPKSGVEKEFIKMHDEIYASIINSNEVEINYLNNKGVTTERRIRPHKYLRYKGEYYIVATCLLTHEIRYFKLVRIKNYRITEDKFEKNLEIEKILKRDIDNSLGIFGGESYDLVLEISPPMSNTISERIWVDNQEITNLDGGKILFKAKMNGGPEVFAWILSMGDSVRIIEPESLREEVKNKLEKMLKTI